MIKDEKSEADKEEKLHDEGGTSESDLEGKCPDEGRKSEFDKEGGLPDKEKSESESDQEEILPHKEGKIKDDTTSSSSSESGSSEDEDPVALLYSEKAELMVKLKQIKSDLANKDREFTLANNLRLKYKKDLEEMQAKYKKDLKEMQAKLEDMQAKLQKLRNRNDCLQDQLCECKFHLHCGNCFGFGMFEIQ